MNRLKNLAVDMLSGNELKVLQLFRDKIDWIDQNLIQLFDQRADLVFKVGEWKKENAYEVHDPKREQQIFEKIIKSHRSQLRDSEVQSLFKRMIEFFRQTEKARTLMLAAQESKIVPEKGTFGFLGFGLIGASVALALREQFPQWKFLVYDPYISVSEFESWNKSKTDSAIQIVNIQQLENLDFLFLAAPIDINNKLGAQLAEKNKFTLNLGSYQDEIGNVFGFHPLAGKESKGYQAAEANLFYGKTICMTHPRAAHQDPTPFLSLRLQETKTIMECLANSLGAELFVVDNDTHNRSLAYSSHLMQILSMALGLTLEKNRFQDLPQLIPNAATELLRLNGSDLNMWGPIFQKNKTCILKAIDDFEANLKDIKLRIAELDTDEETLEKQPKKVRSKYFGLSELFLNANKIYKNIYLKGK